ncbi:MAG TPA: hypothetical protein VKG84_10440, partial [Candidatus Acidoferrales bacterium]|nr:hypothetical protein [Candidatus Acidoferrales bacterium]
PPPPPAAPEPPPVVEAAPEPAPVVESHGGPLVPAEPEAAPVYEYPSVEAEHSLETAPEPIPVVETPAPIPEPVALAAPPVAEAAPPVAVFRVEDLPPDQQELHRRANRHAKVSMQDIYLLRPKDVQAARQNKDVCVRMKADIEKARKEYVRRFNPILEHPVDYFYHWMVEVLAEGKPEVLGEYPYPSPVPRR